MQADILSEPAAVEDKKEETATATEAAPETKAEETAEVKKD